MARPVPCSALSVPPRASTASTMSSVNVGVTLRASRVEALVEHEVQVAVLGVAEDDAALVEVPGEQFGEFVAGAGEPGHGHGDVLQQGGRADGSGAGDGRVQTFTDVPQRGPSARLAAQPGGSGQRQLGEHVRAARPRPVSSSVSGSCHSTSSAAWSRDGEARAERRRPWGRPGRRARIRRPAARSAAGSAATSMGMAAIACCKVGKTSRPVAASGWAGTVRKTASATKPRVPSLPMIRWARICAGESWSRKAVEAVAHGVLQRELRASCGAPSRGCRGPGRAAGSDLRERGLGGRAAGRRRPASRCR